MHNLYIFCKTKDVWRFNKIYVNIFSCHGIFVQSMSVQLCNKYLRFGKDIAFIKHYFLTDGFGD
jgi:hypothetical protein